MPLSRPGTRRVRGKVEQQSARCLFGISFGAPWWRRFATQTKKKEAIDTHTQAHTLERQLNKYLHAEVPGSPLIIHQVLVRGGLQAVLVPDEALGALELEAFLRVEGERAARRR